MVTQERRLGWDAIPEDWKNGEPTVKTQSRYIRRYSAAIFAYQLTEEITNSGADIHFDCMAIDPFMDGNVCHVVITESKVGTEYYSCMVFVVQRVTVTRSAAPLSLPKRDRITSPS